MRRHLTALLVVPLLAVLASCVLPPPGLPPGFRQEVVAGGLHLPTAWVQPPDPAVQYVAEKTGVIRVVRSGQVLATPLVDLRGRVNDGGDRGLMGMALHPGFASNGHLYLAYTYQDPGVPESHTHQTQRVTRITVRGDVADPASEVVVLGRVTGPACYDAWRTPDCLPSSRNVHTIDDLAFDVGGALWVSIGDGAAPGYGRAEADHAQDREVLAGKLLRVHPETGRGLPDNPFFDSANPGSNASRVWALGLRNPFRFSFHPDGTPYVGDVGADRYEEIDVARRGQNFGWPCHEGPYPVPENHDRLLCQAMRWANTPVVAPAAWYGRDQGISVTGGVFYTGGQYPPEYTGSYVYGDYGGSLRRQGFDRSHVATGAPVSFVDKVAAGAPVQIRMGPDGNVWYLSIYPGELRKIVYTAEGAVPASCPDGQYRAEYFNNRNLSGAPAVVRCEAAIDYDWGTAAPTPGVAVDDFSVRWTGRIPLPGGTHRFRATSEDGLRLRINGTTHVDRWFDQPVTTHTRDVRLSEGTHTVVMETYHRSGAAQARLSSARLGTAPSVRITSPADRTRVGADTAVDYRVEATDAEDGTLPAGAVTVDVAFHHYTDDTSFHQHPHHTATGTSGRFVTNFDPNHGPGLYQIVARATDSSGWTSTSAAVHVCLVGNHFGPCG